MTVHKWSTTPNSNDTADSTINLREGMAPSQLNDSGRAMMAAIAKWRDDMSGKLVTTGTSTAYVLSTNQGFTSLTDGLAVAARVNATSGTSPTLNVDSTGAKAIATVYGTAIPSGKIVANGIYTFVYNLADDKWIVHGHRPDEFPSGTTMTFRQTNAPTGWTKDATYNNAAFRVTNGTISQQTTAGNEFTTLLANRTILKANLPDYTLSDTLAISGSQSGGLVRNLSRTLFTSGGGNANVVESISWSDTTLSLTGSVTSGGSGTAMNFDVNYVDLIIAAKN